MIVILVTGGRDYADYDTVDAELSALSPNLVIQGGAKGADLLAYEWCQRHGVHCAQVDALWDFHKRAAGPIRNEVMAKMAKALDALVLAFPGGKGTEKHGAAGREVPAPSTESFMKDKHLAAHIEVCGVISKQSGCPRRKFGAVIINEGRNTILATGYNGGPRGGEGPLCSGWFCERDGVTEDMLKITNQGDGLRYYSKEGREVGARFVGSADGTKDRQELVDIRQGLLDQFKPIKSGTFMERGCHHAEFNAIANAAADGIALAGAALIVTGEPCLMCAKLIHHAGLTRVYCVKGGYLGGSEGPDYLRKHKVEVVYIEGDKDPRA